LQWNYLGASIDEYNDISELNEDNNSLTGGLLTLTSDN
jgi:subtilase family serine protease